MPPQQLVAGLPAAVLVTMESTANQLEALSSRIKQIEKQSFAATTPTATPAAARAVPTKPTGSIAIAEALSDFQPVSLLLTTTSRRAFEAELDIAMKNRLAYPSKERQRWPWHAPLPTPLVAPRSITIRRDQLAKRYIIAPENNYQVASQWYFEDHYGQTVYTWGNQLGQEHLFRTHVRPYFTPQLRFLADQPERIDHVNSHTAGWYDEDDNVHLSPPDAPDGIDEAGPFWVYAYAGGYRAARQLPDALAVGNARPLWKNPSNGQYYNTPQTVNSDIAVFIV